MQLNHCAIIILLFLNLIKGMLLYLIGIIVNKMANILNDTYKYCGVSTEGQGLSCVAVSYLTLYFGYFTLHWLVGVTPCTRKSQKDFIQKKTVTDRIRRLFFLYTFLYFLGSTTIPSWGSFPWIHWNGWFPQLRCQKTRSAFLIYACPHWVFWASIRLVFFW